MFHDFPVCVMIENCPLVEAPMSSFDTLILCVSNPSIHPHHTQDQWIFSHWLCHALLLCASEYTVGAVRLDRPNFFRIQRITRLVST